MEHHGHRAASDRGAVRLHGFLVASEVPLHQGEPCAGTEGADLHVRYGASRAVPAEPAAGTLLGAHERPGGGLFSSVVRTPQSVVLRCHGVCELVLDPSLSAMEVHVDPAAEPGLESVVVGGMGLALVVLLRGHLLLHASAVELDGTAVALVGRSGMGKSTVATLLCQAGAAMLTDDVLRVDVLAAGAVAHRGSREARLRPSSAALALAAGPAARTRVTADARSGVWLRAAEVVELPLAAVLVPYPRRDQDEVSLEQLAPADALVALAGFPRLVGWRDPGTTAEQFALLGELARRVPVAVAHLPWGPPFGPDLGERVASAVRLSGFRR